MSAATEFDLTDPVARLVAADAEQEAGRAANAYLLRGNVALTPNGELTLRETRRQWKTARRALEALQRGDWSAFTATRRRSSKIKVHMSRHNFDGAPLTEVCVGVSCLNRSLAYVRIPGSEPADKWIGMAVRSALALAELSLEG